MSSERPDPEPKVLFIVGKGRSGSTLLDTLLGEVEGFLSTGELWRRWGGRRLSEYPCGCGRELGACPLWAPVLEASLQCVSEELGRAVTESDVLAWERAVERWPRIPRLLSQDGPPSSTWPELAHLARFVGVVYRELASREGARVIVDSSKWPATPGALGLVPGIRSYVVHLVRDPRGVAYSWRRVREFRRGGLPMPRFGPVYSALSWVARNLVADAVRSRAPERSLFLRYEDFVKSPRLWARRILELVGEGDAGLPFVDQRTARLGPNHTVWGNPSRFERGEVEIREDREWRERLGFGASFATVSLTAPLLLRYGYPFRTGA